MITEIAKEIPRTCTKLVDQAKEKLAEEFIESMSSGAKSKDNLLAGILSRTLIRSTASQLWAQYIKEPTAELKLIFRGHDHKKEPLTHVQQLLTLMATGTPEGLLPKGESVNIFPSGFWNLPEVKSALVTQMLYMFSNITSKVCTLHYALPNDWEDEKYAENLYLSVEDQYSELTDALIKQTHKLQVALKESPEQGEPTEQAVDNNV